MEASGAGRAALMEKTTMATPTDAHAETPAREKPTQGIFIGWLAFGLFIFAVLWGAVGIIAGATHGFQ
jgi:hypothetical protein